MHSPPDGAVRPDVSVIIVTWNVRALVLDCLAALYGRADDLTLEVWLVDNGSSDGTPAAVRERFPQVNVLEPGENLGFPRGNNLAAGRATGRHILFLNPDTVVGVGTLRACVDALDRDATIGLVGCRLVYGDGRLQPECGRRVYRLRHLATELFYLHMLFPRSRVFAHQVMGEWDHRCDRDVEAVSGAFMMARREAVARVGGLPEELFMYHEDMAFCLRVARAGWRVRLLGSVETVHYGGQSSSQVVDPRLDLLEGEYKMLLIREGQGAAAAAAGRALFALRSLLRLTAAAGTYVLPGGQRLRARYARLLHPRRHWLHLQWSIAPRRVAYLALGSPQRAQRLKAAGE
jgi:N-acetylglucosaminyl-diphospho-decaprenol L-rhamnosyltransferase